MLREGRSLQGVVVRILYCVIIMCHVSVRVSCITTVQLRWGKYMTPQWSSHEVPLYPTPQKIFFLPCNKLRQLKKEGEMIFEN